MLAGEAAGGDYKDVVLFLATTGVVVPILRRWRISPIPGFLAAGVLLGRSLSAPFISRCRGCPISPSKARGHGLASCAERTNGA